MNTMVRAICGLASVLLMILPAAGWCNQPPAAFELVSPDDGAADVSIPLVLDWEDATDPEGGAIGYTVMIAEDKGFTDPLVWENQPHSTLLVTTDDGLKEDTEYFWKVLAVDEEGGSTEAGPRKFLPSINPTDVVVNGFVYDGSTEAVIPEATLVYGGKALTAGIDGFYQEIVSYAPDYTVVVSADCYLPQNLTIEDVDEGDQVAENFALSRDLRGDIDGADCAALADAVFAIKILARAEIVGTSVRLSADVNGDQAIGLAEVIFILGRVAGIR